jgi:hypothetical protein
METLGLSDSTRKSRSWILELLWPTVDNEVSAETAARNGMWVCIVVGALSALQAVAITRASLASLLVGALMILYFLILGIGVGAGSRVACIVAIFYILSSVALSILMHQFSLPFIPVITIGLLLGSLRAAVALRRFRTEQATSSLPPDLPESAYRESAPEHLRLMAEADERGFLTRLTRVWRRISPGGEIVLTSLTLLYFALIAAGLFLMPFLNRR